MRCQYVDDSYTPCDILDTAAKLAGVRIDDLGQHWRLVSVTLDDIDHLISNSIDSEDAATADCLFVVEVYGRTGYQAGIGCSYRQYNKLASHRACTTSIECTACGQVVGVQLWSGTMARMQTAFFSPCDCELKRPAGLPATADDSFLAYQTDRE